LREGGGTTIASAGRMTSLTAPSQPHDIAIVRALQAMLEDALHRSDFAVARDLAEQIQHEIRRQGARCSRL
jgi:hypothetical protein